MMLVDIIEIFILDISMIFTLYVLCHVLRLYRIYLSIHFRRNDVGRVTRLSRKLSLNKREMSEHLASSIKFITVNYGCGFLETEEIIKMHNFLENTFPTVHSSTRVQLEVVNGLSLLYYVKGSDESLKPYMLCGHLDVSPALDQQEWEEPPFGGIIKDKWIWGKGAVGCKSIVMGTLEALEHLFRKKFIPRRSVYLAFGHDKITGGQNGACEINNLLKSRNVQMEYILDEGGFVTGSRFIPGIPYAVAFIGVAQKGEMTLELSVPKNSESLSEPPEETCITILSKALAKLKGRIFPAKFGRVEGSFFKALASCAYFPFSLMYSNDLIFKELIVLILDKTPLKYIYRTSTAVTFVDGEIEDGMPTTALGQVQLQIHPEQTTEEAYGYVKTIINDQRVQMKKLTAVEPHLPSPIDSFGFKNIGSAIQAVFGNCIAAPITTAANRSTEGYRDLSDCIYHFNVAHSSVASCFRSKNEKISQTNYEAVVLFYIELLKRSSF